MKNRKVIFISIIFFIFIKTMLYLFYGKSFNLLTLCNDMLALYLVAHIIFFFVQKTENIKLENEYLQVKLLKEAFFLESKDIALPDFLEKRLSNMYPELSEEIGF